MFRCRNKKTGQVEKNTLIFVHRFGCLAQLIRASRLHREGRGFESLNIHHKINRPSGDFFVYGDVGRNPRGVFDNESTSILIKCECSMPTAYANECPAAGATFAPCEGIPTIHHKINRQSGDFFVYGDVGRPQQIRKIFCHFGVFYLI